MTTKQLLAQLKKVITKEYGKKECKDFNWYCSLCGIWLAYDLLVSLLIFDWEHEHKEDD